MVAGMLKCIATLIPNSCRVGSTNIETKIDPLKIKRLAEMAYGLILFWERPGVQAYRSITKKAHTNESDTKLTVNIFL